MPKKTYWADDYVTKLKKPEEAVRLFKPGQRVFIGSYCGEPQRLVKEMAAASKRYADLEIIRLMSLESLPLSLIANETDDANFYVRSFYLGSAKPRSLSKNKRFITPINLSEVPKLFKSRRLPLDAAMIQVSPPDDFGWMSMGISVDVSMAAAFAAKLVIVQVNPRMPRVLGRSFIHVNDVDVFVEYEEDLLTIGPAPEFESASQIGRHVAKLIDDGSTLQLSLGATPQAIMETMQDKNDLGVHTQFVTNHIMNLLSMGVITNRKKGFNEGKTVASAAIGSQELYEFLDDNPGIAFYPSDYVNDPSTIAQHSKMCAINVAMAMDLTGQAAADALPYNHYSGVSGIMDFMRGASMAPDGKSILMLPSTTMDGKTSRIVPGLNDLAVVIPRGDVHYVATEYGVFNLFGKTLEERAFGLISIAHPDFRDELFESAKDLGLISAKRKLDSSIYGIYPLKLEETQEIAGEKVLFRPARPVDQRLIQEHFYNLDHSDVVQRFMQEKRIFGRSDLVGMFEVDYVHDLTLVAVVGEIGFERVVAVGGYYLDPATNMAEVAYSVARDWQKRGLSKIIQNKLVEAARDNGIKGFEAYTSPNNQGMIKLFNKQPFKVRTAFDGDMVTMRARFDEAKE